MPTVPTYQRTNITNNVPDVQLQSVPARWLSTGEAGQAGERLGNTIVNAGNEINNEQIVQQEKMNKIAVMNAVTGAMNDYNSKYSDLMGQNGVNALGKAAANGQPAVPSVTQQGKIYADNIINQYAGDKGSLTNDAQKMAFTQMFNEHVLNSQRFLYEHERQQANIAALDSHKALMQGYADGFATNIATGNYDGANAALRQAIGSSASVGKTMGWAPEVQDANTKSYLDSTIGNSVLSLLKDGRLDDALNARNYYDDKLDEKTKLLLDSRLAPLQLKRDALNTSNDLFGKYGFDERAGMDELRNQYINDPTKFAAFASAYKARLTDEKMFKRQDDLQYRQNLAQQIDGSASLSDAQDLINNSNLPVNVKNQLSNAVKAKFKTLSGSPTPEQKFYSKYEATGLYKDNEKMREYSDHLANGDDITPQQQTIYNEAAIRMNNYWKFASGGAYDGKQQVSGGTGDNNPAEIDNSPVSQAIRQAASATDGHGNRLYTKEQILEQLHQRGITGYDDYVW